MSLNSEAREFDEDIKAAKDKIGIFKSLLPNKNKHQEYNQIVFGMTEDQFVFKLKKQAERKKI
jgi:hypothetical protein